MNVPVKNPWRNLWPVKFAVFFIICICSQPTILKAENGSMDIGRTEGRVLRLEGPEAYIDLGKKDGISEGMDIILYRRVSAIHPETGKRLEDRFRLVKVSIIEAGEVLSLVHLPSETASLVRVGDDVRLASASLKADKLPEELREEIENEIAVVEKMVRDVEPDFEDFRKAFRDAAGTEPEIRIQVWGEFLDKHPQSELTTYVMREIASIRDLREEKVEKIPPPRVMLTSPHVIRSGDKASIVATLQNETVPAELILHFRRPEHQAYRYVLMQKYGDGAYHAKIPSSMIRPPYVDWKVTMTDKSGREYRGGTGSSYRLFVEKPPEGPGKKDRSRVHLAYQYVDFYRFAGLDGYSQFEADFLYRTLYPYNDGQDVFPQFYSLKMGFGAFHGIGGSVSEVERAASAGNRRGLTQVGFNFGYAELEFRLMRNLALISRGIVGISEDGLESGIQGRLRVGQETGTSLVLGALGVGGIGKSWLLQLAWDTVPDVPMNASVEVTTWPVAGDDLGVRLLYEARYRLTPWFEIGARAGYGLRNINHGGMTLGIGTVFSW